MAIRDSFIGELKHESSMTRKMLERVPLDPQDPALNGWKPHEKSMTLGRLATHVADLTHWISDIIYIDDYDFKKHYNPDPPIANTMDELLDIFQIHLDKAVADLLTMSDEDFAKSWTVRRGEQHLFSTPKKISIRAWGFNHLYHHRGQLSVYLRLLEVPVPGMYGPSADERM